MLDPEPADTGQASGVWAVSSLSLFPAGEMLADDHTISASVSSPVMRGVKYRPHGGGNSMVRAIFLSMSYFKS